MNITQSFSVVYRELFTTKARYILLWGGRSRGGSHAATAFFLHLVTQPYYFRGYFMREIHSDVRGSLWQDFKDRIEEAEGVDERLFDLNESQMAATYVPTGNTIHSKGFKKSAGNRTAKLKSLAGATHVIIEEAEEISEADFQQLDDSLRTVKGPNKIILLFNPPGKNHWIWDRWFIKQDSKEAPGYYTAIPKPDPMVLSIFSDYRDNLVNIDPAKSRQWEEFKTKNPDYYWTVVRGLISEGARGRIYRNWQICQKMPATYPKFYGLDWGFSNDPLALVECEVHNRQLWVEEKIYQTGMTNDDLHRELIRLNVPKAAPIYADSAQPKDIEDMRRRGWNFLPAQKGPGSVRSGVKFIQQYEVFYTVNSQNLQKESEEYRWALDIHKNPTDEPIDQWNHCMDAINYAMDRVRRPNGVNIIKPSSSPFYVAANGRSEYNM